MNIVDATIQALYEDCNKQLNENMSEERRHQILINLLDWLESNELDNEFENVMDERYEEEKAINIALDAIDKHVEEESDKLYIFKDIIGLTDHEMVELGIYEDEDEEENSIRKESKEVKGNKLQKSEKIQEGEYEDYIENEKALAEDYKSRVLNNITPDIRNNFNDLKDIMDTDTEKTLVDGFYLSEKAVTILKIADKSHHLNSYMNLTISDILNMVDDNDTIEGAINELFEEYNADSAYSWADNFVTILSKLDFNIQDEDELEEYEDEEYFEENKKLTEDENKIVENNSSLDGEDLTNTFKNYKAFESNFGPIKIVKNYYDKNYKVYKVNEEDADNYIYYSDNKENIEGWLYGAVQAANGKFNKLKNKNEAVNKSILNEEDEETLDEVINRAHQEEISAIDTYDTVLSKTNESTDAKLIEMINEIKKDEEDHKTLLQHYIETGEVWTDEDLEKEDKEDTEFESDKEQDIRRTQDFLNKKEESVNDLSTEDMLTDLMEYYQEQSSKMSFIEDLDNLLETSDILQWTESIEDYVDEEDDDDGDRLEKILTSYEDNDNVEGFIDDVANLVDLEKLQQWYNSLEKDESKKVESVQDAVTALDSFVTDGKLDEEWLQNECILTIENTENLSKDIYNSRRKAHSIAYDGLLNALSVRVGKDVTSKEVQSAFKKLGLDYKEVLKPVVEKVEELRADEELQEGCGKK